MSGKPLKSPSDASKYRQQYLATLALQANINDANLQANKIYKRTGQTPTQPTDMRLTSEKLADIERLKIEVRAQLASIMDGQDAQATIASLPTEALQFVAQNINQIVKEIKPRYQLGIPATVFEVWLNNYMRKSSEVNEVAYGLQQNDGAGVILGAEQIRELINEAVLRQLGEVSGRLKERQRRIVKRRIDDLEPIVDLEDELTTIGQIQDVTTRHFIQQLLNDIFNNLPLQAEVEQVLTPLNNALDRKDEQLTEVYINKLDDILTVEPSAVQGATQLQEMLDSIKKGKDPDLEEIGYGGGGGKEGKPTKRDRDFEYNLLRYEQEYGELNPNKYDDVKISKEDLTVQIDDALRISPYYNKPGGMKSREYYNLVIEKKNTQGKLTGTELRQIYRRIIEELIRLKNGGKSFQYEASAPPPPFETESTITLPYSKAPIRFSDDPISVKQGKGIGGRKKITRVVDYDQGIGPIDHYAPFGRIFINTDKLKRGIVSVRKGKGVHITCLKVQRVSPNLNDIIHKIVGNGMPSYGQLSKLSDDEREYLYKLGKHSDLLDKIGIEAPTKLDDDADINQFEIYKGQISSGNDSVEMIKDFKKLIVKMIGKKLLPPGQAKALLLSLTEMGY
jgi:hypothetical protein